MNFFIFIYHGYGWAVFLILAGSCGGIEVLLRTLNIVPNTASNLTGSLAFILASVPCWFLGRYLLSYQATVKDKEIGQISKVPQPYHALFWIPMHWWAPIFMVIGVSVLISDALKASVAGPRQTPASAIATSVSQHPQTIQGGTLPYSITIPATWEFARAHEHFDIFIKASNSNSYWLGVDAVSESEGDTEAWTAVLLRDLPPKIGGVLTRSNAVTIDSHEWAVLNGTMRDKGSTLTCRVYAYADRNSEYAIVLVATPTAWSSHETELISIARSFKFPSR